MTKWNYIKRANNCRNQIICGSSWLRTLDSSTVIGRFRRYCPECATSISSSLAILKLLLCIICISIREMMIESGEWNKGARTQMSYPFPLILQLDVEKHSEFTALRVWCKFKIHYRLGLNSMIMQCKITENDFSDKWIIYSRSPCLKIKKYPLPFRFCNKTA